MGKKSAVKRIVADPSNAFAAQVFAVAPRAAAKAREPWKIGCIHRLADPTQGCDERFDPHGVGALSHSSCSQGKAVMRAMSAAGKAGEADAAAARERALAIIAEVLAK